jgi:hypothetical protein
MASQHSTDDCILVDTQLLDELPEDPFDEALIDPALSSTPLSTPVPSTTLVASQPLSRSNTPSIAIHNSARYTPLRWSPEMQETLLATLLDQCRVGKRADSGFKREAWIAVIIAIEAIAPNQVNEKQIKSHMDWFKSMWKEWCALEENQGLVGMNLLSFLQLKIMYRRNT